VVRVPGGLAKRALFSELDWITGKDRAAFNYCLEFANAAENPRSRGPLLMGPSGCGKTHLLWAMARRVAEYTKDRVDRICTAHWKEMEKELKDGALKAFLPSLPKVEVRVTDGSEMAHELRSSIEKKNLDSVVARFRQTEAVARGGHGFLFVDDVEIAKLSDWLHEELYRIINYRYAEAMPTAFATNLSPDELRDALGDRLARRIVDMTEPFVMGVH